MKDANTFVYKALEQDLIIYNNISPINIIVISGDLVDCGSESFENDLQLGLMTFEESFIDRIAKAIKLPKNRFFFVPGNHDIAIIHDEA
jgi:3',5'-cyclic AMP phosphodiesterase CpdA